MPLQGFVVAVRLVTLIALYGRPRGMMFFNVSLHLQLEMIKLYVCFIYIYSVYSNGTSFYNKLGTISVPLSPFISLTCCLLNNIYVDLNSFV